MIHLVQDPAAGRSQQRLVEAVELAQRNVGQIDYT
jgi:hypothetical protein